jgi:hypothetical protein
MPKFAEVDRTVTLERFLTGVNRRDSQAAENLIQDAGWELEASMRWVSLFRRFADAGAGGDRWRDEPACRGVTVSCSRFVGWPRRIDEIKILIGQGDFVFIAAKGWTDGEFRAFADILRLENGKLAEHWGTVDELPPPEERKNDNGML